MENVRKANLSATEDIRYVVYNDGDLAFCRDMRDTIQATLPVQLEIYGVALVQEGKVMASINGEAYEAQKNDLFICPPNIIIEKSLMSLDCKGCFIFMSEPYVQRIMPLSENTWDIKFLFEKHPLCHLEPEEATTFCQYYDLLCSKVQSPLPAQKRVIDTLMLAFIYDMSALLGRFIQPRTRPFTSGEHLFKRFVELLESSYPKQRAVSYYADRLSVTPKYLSFVCKKAGGLRPSEIIDRYVLKDIDYLMKHTQKSIKEIAWELEFPNLSFFGKYVKKHLGVSPKMYREQSVKAEAATHNMPK